jgi:AraC family transcriptional regulator
MMKAALQNYHARVQRVLDYIDRHLDSDLDLETLTGVAALSKFHFHGPVGRCSPYRGSERNP